MKRSHSMALSDDERADEALREKLQGVLLERAARAGLEQGLVLTDWVVVAAAEGFDSGGERVTQVLVMPDTSVYRAMGLLEHARVRFQADVLADYEDR